MRRLACVDLPAFPLQLLAQQNPAWLEKPMAVVAEEKPQAFLLWVNEKARALGIRPGHRYAAALALSAELRAGAVSEAAVREGVEKITEILRRFTPDVEPAGIPGLFWLNASGLERLYPSLDSWAEAIRETLRVSSIVAIDSLRLRRRPSFGVLATKMPPPGPVEARIRWEPASSLNASRSVGLLTPNSAASSCSVPRRSPGRRLRDST